MNSIGNSSDRTYSAALRDYFLSRKNWNIETKRQAGSGVTPGNVLGATHKDFRIIGTAEADWDAVRLILLNYEVANSPKAITANFAPTANMTVTNTPTGTWTNFTWTDLGGRMNPNGGEFQTGLTSVDHMDTTLGPSGASGKPIPTLAISDWMSGANIQSVARNDGGLKPMWMITIHHPTGPGTYTYSFESQSSVTFDTDLLTYGRRFYKMFQSNVDGVAVPANFTQTVESNNAPPFIIQFRSRGRVLSFACVGYSILGGSGTTSNMLSAGFRACVKASTPDFPVQYFGLGYAGRKTIDSLAEAKDILPYITPHVAAYSVFSPNDSTLSASVSKTLMRQALEFVHLCVDNDILPILVTPTPDNTDSSTISGLKSSLTTEILALRTRGIIVADFWNTVSTSPGRNTSTGSGWKDGLGISDGQHMSDTGAELLAQEVLAKILKDIVDLNSK